MARITGDEKTRQRALRGGSCNGRVQTRAGAGAPRCPRTEPQGTTRAYSLERGESLPEASQRDRNADARLLRLKDDEDCGLAGLQLLNEWGFGDDLGVAGEVVATHKRGVTHVLIVNLQSEARRQQHAQGREHPQHALAVGELLK